MNFKWPVVCLSIFSTLCADEEGVPAMDFLHVFVLQVHSGESSEIRFYMLRCLCNKINAINTTSHGLMLL